MPTLSRRCPMRFEVPGLAHRRSCRATLPAIAMAVALAACAPNGMEPMNAPTPPATMAEVQAEGGEGLQHVLVAAVSATGSVSAAELVGGRPDALRHFCEAAIRPLGIVPSADVAPAQARGVAEALAQGGWGWELAAAEQAAVIQLACAAHLGLDGGTQSSAWNQHALADTLNALGHGQRDPVVLRVALLAAAGAEAGLPRSVHNWAWTANNSGNAAYRLWQLEGDPAFLGHAVAAYRRVLEAGGLPQDALDRAAMRRATALLDLYEHEGDSAALAQAEALVAELGERPEPPAGVVEVTSRLAAVRS